MAGPTPSEIALVNNAASTAKDAFTALMDIQTFLTLVAYNPTDVAGIEAADWTGASGSVPGPLTGFSPADFTALVTELTAVAALVSANNAALGLAVAAMAKRG